MNTYKVTVCRFGNKIVKADSEEEARMLVNNLSPEQIYWTDPTDKMPLFVITYVELVGKKVAD